MPESVKVTNGAIKSLLGLDATKNADPEAQPDNVSFMRRFSPAEAKAFLKQVFVTPDMRRVDDSAAGIISYLKPIHKEIGEKILNAEKMASLAPEIEQSKILVSSSIMSPNDLQDGRFVFSFENVPGVDSDPELAADLAEVYDQFYNDTLQLGVKSYDWIGDIQYKTGSKPVLILPVATQIAAKFHTPQGSVSTTKSVYDFGPGMASFNEYTKMQDSNDDFMWSEHPLSWKEALEVEDPEKTVEEMVPSMESFGVKVPNKFKPQSRTSSQSEYGDDYVAGLEAIVVNMRSTLEEGDLVKVSENPEILRFSTQKKLVDKMDIYKKLQKKYNTELQHEEVVYLDANPKDIKHQGHATIIELPAESVIPIHIPGAPKEHVGYFVLLDNFGQPLTIDASGMAGYG